MKYIKLTICSMVVLFSTGYINASVVVSQSITSDLLNQKLDFMITFDRAPDFYTVDMYGRQADSFQYNIDTDCQLPFAWSMDEEIVIRGGEIHFLGKIPIRNKNLNEIPSAVNGGWGGISEMVPFDLTGSVLTFSTSLALIASEGQFSYCLMTCEYGNSSFTDIWGIAPIPEPASLLLLALGGIWAIRKKQPGV